MKFAQLSALSAALMLISAAQANELIDDGALDIRLQNYYLDAETKENGVKTSGTQWSQAFSADFSSGFFANIIGFDLGAHYALKLRGDLDDDYDGNPGLLLKNNEGKSKSYGKTSYAIKVNLADMGEAKYGRMFLETPLLNNNYSRSLPGLTEAFYAEGDFEGVNLYGIWASETNMRAQSGFMDLMVNGKKEPVKIIGGGYDMGNGFAANLAMGQQNNYQKRYYADVGYAMEMQGLSLDSTLIYGHNNMIGYTKESATDKDHSQNLWGLKVSAGMHQATLGLSYQNVEKTGNDFKNTWSGKGDMVDPADSFGPNSMLISDFNGDGQKSWAVHAGYDFTGMVDGLSVDFVYATGGKNPKGNDEDEKEKEYNLIASYDLPQVENLSLAAKYGKNIVKGKDSGEKETTQQFRMIIRYDMAVF